MVFVASREKEERIRKKRGHLAWLGLASRGDGKKKRKGIECWAVQLGRRKREGKKQRKWGRG